METRVIKSITEVMCPFCSEKILVSTRMTAPTIDWALKPKDIEDAKKKFKEELKEIAFKSEDEKKQLLSWVDDERTLFGPPEVSTLLDQIRKDQNTEKQAV